MGTKARGQVLTRQRKSGTSYALRFLAYGERRYVTLGTAQDGWTRQKAQIELENILADVRRGLWIPPDQSRTSSTRPTGGPGEPVLFEDFALDRLRGRVGEVSARTYEFEEWALRLHLLPYFGSWPVSDIDIAAVDDYRQFKVKQARLRQDAIDRGEPLRDDRGNLIKPLAPQTINRTIAILSSILELAVEYGHLASNPAAGRRRRLKKRAIRPVHLDSPHQIRALLDAAAQLDRESRWPTTDRLANVATLVLAGPRAHELTNARWRDLDLANGRIEIGRSKTEAGLREIHLFPLLRAILADHKARCARAGPNDLIFPTAHDTQRSVNNLRSRILMPTLTRADELLEHRGQRPLPAGGTPHKLRHTFASILVACGEDPISVMAQLGHADPKFTLKIYAHLMRRNPTERAQLKALVNASNLDSVDALKGDVENDAAPGRVAAAGADGAQRQTV